MRDLAGHAVRALKRHWDRFGRRDPYWAILTDPDKRGGKWDIDEFFRSGVAEIEAVLRHGEQLGVAHGRRRALDFGCGAGRLTQAMAGQFETCDGVDVSASMLQAARRHDRHPDRCTYHLNTAPDLALFPDDSFDFVYSTLVLQHIAPRYSTVYVRELVRVLAPGGLLMFQLPSQRSTQEPPAGATRTPIRGTLAADAWRARLAIHEYSTPALNVDKTICGIRNLAPGTGTTPSLSFAPGESRVLDVAAENLSARHWPALADAHGRRQINVANRWLHEDGEVLQANDGRCPFAFDVAPGTRASVTLIVKAPPTDGAYLLELDVVQEDVGWFGERGSATLQVPVVVGRGRLGPPRPPRVVPPPPARFSTRYPRVFRVLQVTGLRDAYWDWRRAMDRLKTVRDRVIVDVRDRLYLPRIINWWKRGPFSPLMEMHCVPRAEVLAIVEQAGGRMVTVEAEWMTGYESCRYWISKDDLLEPRTLSV